MFHSQRINSSAPNPELKVQMRTRRQATHADIADDLPLFYTPALLNTATIFAQMCIGA